MRIQEVRLGGFGRFTDLNLSFPSPLQLIVGPNEAGKSTVVDAIAGVLFGFRRSQRHLRDRYQPWRGGSYAASVVLLADDGTRYLVGRDFRHDRVEIFIGRGLRLEPLPEGKLEEILQEVLGLNSLALFESTLLLRQQEMNLIARDRGVAARLAEMIGRKITGVGDGTTGRQALALIRTKLAGLGEDTPLVEELAAREREQADLRARAGRLAALREERTRLAALLDAIPADGPPAPAPQEPPAAAPAARTLARAEEIANQIAQLEVEMRFAQEEARQFRTEITLLEQEIAATGAKIQALKLDPESRSRVAALLAPINAHSARLADLFPRYDYLREKLRRSRLIRRLCFFLGFLGAGAALAATEYLRPDEAWLAVGAAGLLALLTALQVFRARGLAGKASRLLAEIERREEELKRDQEELDRILQGKTPGQYQAELEAGLVYQKELWDLEQLLALKKAKMEERTHLAEIEERLAASRQILAEILDAAGCRDLDALRSQAAQEAAAANRVPGPAETAIQEPSLSWAPAEGRDALAARLAEIERELAELGTAPARELLEVEDECAAARAALERAAIVRRGLTLAARRLEEVLYESEAALGPELQTEVGETLAAVTEGRYREVRLEPGANGLVIRVRMPETAELADPSSLSAGTLDLLYLALRLALAGRLTRGRSYPLVLDDPFPHLDRTRTTGLARALARLSRTNQVIWFTKDFGLPGLIRETTGLDPGIIELSAAE
ncbi:MAG: ATP-binding protein [Bacteroidota bacterium]